LRVNKIIKRERKERKSTYSLCDTTSIFVSLLLL